MRSIALVTIVVLALAPGMGGCTGGPPQTSAHVEVLAQSRDPLNGRATNDYDPPQLRSDLTRAISAFGADMLAEMSATDKGNIAFSPFSAYSALALAQGGARNATLEEMKAALHTDGITGESADSSYANLLAQFQAMASGTPMRLEVANSMWLDNNLEVDDSFLDRNTTFYGAQVARLDLQSPEAPKAVNRWVWDNTGHKIDKLVDAIDPETIAILCNAVYFKDAWEDPFAASMTSNRDFRLTLGTTVQVPTMVGPADAGHIKTADYEAAAIPTKGGAKFWVFVPADGAGPADVLTSLSELYARGSTLEGASQRDMGSIYLPKFDIEWKGSLKPALQALGMRTAFSRDRAEFPSFKTGRPVWIGDVVQAATTTIDEEGLEASAATEVAMGTLAAAGGEPFELHADRPFVYAITAGDAVLFMGVVNDPR